MNTTHSSYTTRIKVGVFTLVGLLAVGLITIIANGEPFWRPCQLVNINVEDATGLKTKAPIRSLGIEIGYLKSVMLSETHVTLGICITEPVEVLPSTRAYIRADGFLGDKFVELKPVKYQGPRIDEEKEKKVGERKSVSQYTRLLELVVGPSAWAANPPPGAQVPPSVVTPLDSKKGAAGNSKEIPVGEETQDVQHLVNRVDELVHQMTQLTDNLKQDINPEDLRRTMKQLNSTLENASKTLAPEGGLNQTAQRSLAKLEDAIEQLRDLMTRVNKGEGSVGMLLNDPSYAEEIRQAIKNVNRLLTRVGDVRFIVDLGANYLTAYNGGRAWFQLGIWPRQDRYYLLGIAFDPRGRITTSTVTTTVGNLPPQVTQTQTNDPTSLLFTAMLGKVFFKRLDASVGALYSDGAGSLAVRLGPEGMEERIQIRNDVYFRTAGSSIDDRITLSVQPWNSLYFRVGVESIRGYSGTGQPIFFAGAGLSFDDEDIKLLFALR